MRSRKSTPSKPPRGLLCMHGSGGSGAIFRVQLAKLRLALKNDFEFVFATAPVVDNAGPGVLPLFEGMGPYYSWFGREDDTVENDLQGANAVGTVEYDERMAALEKRANERVQPMNEHVQKVMEDWQRTKPETPIVGIVAFSEGALAATLLIWQQQMGRLPWFPKLSVALYMCAHYSEAATFFMKVGSQGIKDNLMIKVPTLHLQGCQDTGLQNSKKLVAVHYSSSYADELEFYGQHQCPTRPNDIKEAAKRFMALYDESRTTGKCT